jgi:hypothetical protein
MSIMRLSTGLLALALAVLAAALPLPTRAADTYELPAGGLLFVPDERTTIEAQEVVIDRQSVRATYAVRNRTPDIVSRIVSFVLPEIDMNVLGEEVVVLASADPVNFASAVVAIDGIKVALGFEQRAWAFARDVTAVLEAAGVPLNPLASGVVAALARLPPEQIAALEERGVVQREEERIVPNWSVRTTAFWRQTFEPGKLVNIGLAYTPVTASGPWGAESLARLKDAYCVDGNLAEAIARRQAEAGRGLVAHRISYTMASEPGWWAAIPNYRLAIEKPGFEALVATCVKDMRAVGPTLLEWIGRDYRPGQDIRVLIVN